MSQIVPPTVGKRWRRAIASAITVIASTVVALAICEVTLRLKDGIPLWPLQNIAAYKATLLAQIVAAEYDPLLGWRQRPDFSGRITTGPYGFRTNERGKIRPLPSNAIFIVGDSFTAGSDVLEHQTYPSQLERLLDYPVINGGVGGYGSDQMILAAEQYLPILKPAVVAVGILDDDINRTGYSVVGHPKPWLEVGADGVLRHHNQPVPTLPTDWDVQPSPLGYSYLAMWTAGHLGLSAFFQAKPSYAIVAKNDPVLVTCALLRQLKGLTDAQRTPLLVVMLHGGSDQAAVLDRSRDRPRPDAVAKCSAQAGIETLDLWEPLTALAKTDPAAYRDLYFHVGPKQESWGHMTAAGNDFVARQIAPRVRSQGWLTRPVS